MKKLTILTLLLFVASGSDCPMDGSLPAGNGNDNSNGPNTDGTSDWPQEVRLTAFDPAVEDFYGCRVAAAQSTFLVATELKDSLAGVVDVFVNVAGEWRFDSRLERGDARMPEQSFGSSVAVSNSQAFVGAQKYAIPGSSHIQRGAVYVFTNRGSIFEQVQLLTIPDGQDFDHFGNAMAHDTDQGRLIVGAVGRNTHEGAAYVFRTNGGTFSQESRLTASDAVDNDNFGRSMAMSNVWAAVGAPGKQLGVGAVYVFERSGLDWAETQKIVAPDGETTDQFGFAVAMHDDLLIVSAPGRKRPGDDLLRAGAVYIYRRQVGGTFSLEDTLVPDDGHAGTFGISVAVRNGRVAVGIPPKGRVLIFEQNGNSWSPTATIAPTEGTNGLDSFGNAMDLAEDHLIVGAESSDVNGRVRAGAAYIFTTPDAPEPPELPPGVRVRRKKSESSGCSNCVADAKQLDRDEGDQRK